MNKAANYVSFDPFWLTPDANVVVDGRRLHTDRECLSMYGNSKVLIDLGEILSIHHITAYFENIYESRALFGMYIPIFSIVP